jgi:hypothetical protein
VELLPLSLRLKYEAQTMEVYRKNTKNNWTIMMALSLTLGVSSLVSPTYATTVSTSAPLSEAPIQVSMPQKLVNHLQGDAIVKTPLKNGQLLVTVNSMQVALTISDETLIISTKTGQPASLKALKANDRIYVYYSAAMTKSLPPQLHAIAIITGVEKNKSHAQLFTVREVTSRKEGEVRALNNEGNLIVSITKDIALTPFKPKQMASLEDIRVGTQLFIWYDIVAMSYPGQTAASKAVLIGQEEGFGIRAVYTPWAGLDAVTVLINNVPVTLSDKKLMDQNGLLMLPLSTVAQNLGFKVTWNSKDKSVLLDDGTIITTVTIGNESYFKAPTQALNLTNPFNLGAAPIIVDDRTYVPASFFNLLYYNNEAVKLESKK